MQVQLTTKRKALKDSYTGATERPSCNAVFLYRPTRGALNIDFRLSNEYSNGDGHATNSIKTTDDVLTVAAALWVALCTCAIH
jgi:hypothetical protein